MIGRRSILSDGIGRPSEAEHGRGADFHDGIGGMLARPAANADGPPEADLSNVVPFARSHRECQAQPAPAITVSPADRFLGAIKRNRGRLAVLLACSVAAHAALYLPFMREPDPMASVGEQVISVEIVVGANEDAGLVKQGGDQAASAPEPARTPKPEAETPKPIEPETETQRVDNALLTPPMEQKPVEVQQALAQEAAPTQTMPTEAKPAAGSQVATAQPAEQPAVKLRAPAEPVPDQPAAPAEIQAAPMTPVAPAELQASRNPEAATEAAAPLELQPLPEPPRPEIAKPTPPRPTLVRQPPKPQPNEVVAKPQQPRAPPKAETRRASLAGAPNESRSTAPAAAGGIGRGRLDADSNYPGLVAAQIRRNLQFPADARSRGATGSATVSFGVGGSGGVTSVRLVRGTGVASLDAEATAVVRRASPFPPPPGGRAQRFTVPIGFRLN